MCQKQREVLVSISFTSAVPFYWPYSSHFVFYSCSFPSHKNLKFFLKKILQLLNVYGKCVICKVLSAQGKANWNMTFLVMIWVVSRVSPSLNEDIHSILFSSRSLQTSETFSGNADYAEWRCSHGGHLGGSVQQILKPARLFRVLGWVAGGATPAWLLLHPGCSCSPSTAGAGRAGQGQGEPWASAVCSG